MLRLAYGVSFAMVLCLGAGCSSGGGGASGTPGVKPLDGETNYSQAIRQSALSVRDALKSEGGVVTTKGNVESLLESLQDYEKKCSSANKGLFGDVEAAAKEVKSLCDSKAKKAQLQPKVDQLVAAAEKLPSAK